MSGFSEKDVDGVHAFLQWKNTDACFDFYCECGAHCHFDGFFGYFVQCPHCKTAWEMPCMLIPRKANNETRDNPQMMEPDEDMQ